MNTTELIKLLKDNEFGGATGRPRELSFEFRDMLISDPEIEITGSGDGLFTSLTLGLESDNVYYDEGDETDLLNKYIALGTPEEISAVIDQLGSDSSLRDHVNERLDIVRDIPTDRLKEIADAYRDHRELEIPVRVGSVVYLLMENLVTGETNIVPSRLLRMVWRFDSTPIYSCYVNCPEIGNTLEYYEQDFGKEVFATREEAEKALAGRGKTGK